MKMVLICLIGLGATNLLAQNPLHKDTINTDTIRSRRLSVLKIGYEIEGKDTLPVYLLSKFNFNSNSPKSQAEKDAFVKLNKLAAFRLQMMEDNLNLLSSEKAKRKYIKECEKAIKKQFMDDLKNMYVEEGRILLKLIHRETGKTTFDIMKNYGGTFETIFFQVLAKSYNTSMKVTYDPVIDYQIEEIIKSIEAQ
jgi:hypothetical protein